MDDQTEYVNWYSIHKVLMRYCRGVDRYDIPLLLSAFHEDAAIHYFDGMTGNAWEIFSKFTPDSFPVLCPQRTISNLIVDFEGDTAHSEAYAVAYYTMARDNAPMEFIVWGIRYLDRMERRDGTWRIAHRRVVHDWDTIMPVNRDYPEHHEWMKGRLTGRKDSGDPSYRQRP